MLDIGSGGAEIMWLDLRQPEDARDPEHVLLDAAGRGPPVGDVRRRHRRGRLWPDGRGRGRRGRWRPTGCPARARSVTGPRLQMLGTSSSVPAGPPCRWVCAALRPAQGDSLSLHNSTSSGPVSRMLRWPRRCRSRGAPLHPPRPGRSGGVAGCASSRGASLLAGRSVSTPQRGLPRGMPNALMGQSLGQALRRAEETRDGRATLRTRLLTAQGRSACPPALADAAAQRPVRAPGAGGGGAGQVRCSSCRSWTSASASATWRTRARPGCGAGQGEQYAVKRGWRVRRRRSGADQARGGLARAAARRFPRRGVKRATQRKAGPAAVVLSDMGRSDGAPHGADQPASQGLGESMVKLRHRGTGTRGRLAPAKLIKGGEPR